MRNNYLFFVSLLVILCSISCEENDRIYPKSTGTSTQQNPCQKACDGEDCPAQDEDCPAKDDEAGVDKKAGNDNCISRIEGFKEWLATMDQPGESDKLIDCLA